MSSVWYAFSRPVKWITGYDCGATGFYTSSWAASGIQGTWTQQATDAAATVSAVTGYAAAIWWLGGLVAGLLPGGAAATEAGGTVATEATLSAEQVAFWEETATTSAYAFEQAELQLDIALIDGTVQEQMWWLFMMDTAQFWLAIAGGALGRW